MNAALPAVVTRLLAVLPTLSGWSQVGVYDGPNLAQDYPPSFVTVGFVDGEDFGGGAEATPTAGDLLEAAETLRSEIGVQTGNTGGMADVRAQAFALLAAWQQWVDADPTLGVPGVSGAALSWDYQPIQNDRGKAVRLAVTLNYVAQG
jgi:hypothetical protein